MNLRINSIDYSGSIVDGPGIRTVLFVQGCERKCVGCHNPTTWDMNKGVLLEINDIIGELREKCINKKLTISGGEPLLQYAAILKLVKKLNDFDIALYTSFNLDEVPAEILPFLHYIKVGEFILQKKTAIVPYIGSTNQNFINLGGVKDEIN